VKQTWKNGIHTYIHYVCQLQRQFCKN
jgi:hypothetical protein